MTVKINTLGLFLYNIFLFLFRVGVRITALFNIKARKWIEGRKGIWEKLQAEIGSIPSIEKSRIIWMHCASLGEFEQGRPLLEKLKAGYPENKILLTFFSPSGYEIRKDYRSADWVFYLPMDSPGNAKRFLRIVNPGLVIFVKYEFWYYYLNQARQNNIPLLLVAALFRDSSVFFKWYGGLQRKMLSFFDHLFVQDDRSRELLTSINVHHVSVSGDTRFDRVIEIAEQSSPIPVIEKFIHNSPAIVAGSTWPPDEEILQKAMRSINNPDLKLIIAPHEIGADHITSLQKLFPYSIKWTAIQASRDGTLSEEHQNARVLIIDNIGMLSRLYKYATITYVGGGFGKGIHNTLEAAVYGKPVLFGPAYRKFREAVELIKTGGAIPVANENDCLLAFQKLLNDPQAYRKSCESAKRYVWDNRGATEIILGYVQEKRLLTS